MRIFRCPLCMNTADIMSDKDQYKFDYKYTLDELRDHVMVKHDEDDYVPYVMDDAEDPDLNYYQEKEKREMKCKLCDEEVEGMEAQIKHSKKHLEKGWIDDGFR